MIQVGISMEAGVEVNREWACWEGGLVLESQVEGVALSAGRGLGKMDTLFQEL